MIEVNQLCKTYGDRLAIDHLTFKINSGDVVGFLGPNGAGKSTTMKIITGFLAPTSGDAKICGFDVFAHPLEVKKRIGYLPENPPVYLDLSVQEYLEFVYDLKQAASINKKDLVEKALKKTQLQDVRARLIKNLSKGFKQRVGIAQALVTNPEVLILDEPTVGLDPKQVIEVRELIKELKGQHTLVVSTHILPEVQSTCNRVIIIHQGKIVAYDDIEHLEKMNQTQIDISFKTLNELNVVDIQNKLNQELALSVSIKLLETKSYSLSFQSPQTEMIESVLEKILIFLVKEKVGIIEYKPQTQNLEDVFLKLTYNNQQSQIM